MIIIKDKDVLEVWESKLQFKLNYVMKVAAKRWEKNNICCREANFEVKF